MLGNFDTGTALEGPRIRCERPHYVIFMPRAERQFRRKQLHTMKERARTRQYPAQGIQKIAGAGADIDEALDGYLTVKHDLRDPRQRRPKGSLTRGTQLRIPVLLIIGANLPPLVDLPHDVTVDEYEIAILAVEITEILDPSEFWPDRVPGRGVEAAAPWQG